jgi:hypothetical protein
MNLAKRLIGETTTTGDVAPVMTGSAMLSNPAATAARRRIPTASPDKQRKFRSRVVSGIIGQLKEDSRDGSVIPADAKELTTLDTHDAGLPTKEPKIPGEKIKNPYSGDEPLILPAASLVAPDVTPEALWPLDPSQVVSADQGQAPVAAAPVGAPVSAAPPGQSPTVDFLLHKEGGQAAPPPPGGPPMSTESAMSKLPGIPSPSTFASVPASMSGTDLLAARQPMPEPVNNSIKSVMESYAKFVPRSSTLDLGGL